MTHICVIKVTIIGSDNGSSPGRRQAIIWTKCWDTVNRTLGNKLQWNLNRNLYIFIQENAFENVVWKMAAIMSRPQCVKAYPTFFHSPNQATCGRLVGSSIKKNTTLIWQNSANFGPPHDFVECGPPHARWKKKKKVNLTGMNLFNINQALI